VEKGTHGRRFSTWNQSSTSTVSKISMRVIGSRLPQNVRKDFFLSARAFLIGKLPPSQLHEGNRRNKKNGGWRALINQIAQCEMQKAISYPQIPENMWIFEFQNVTSVLFPVSISSFSCGPAHPRSTPLHSASPFQLNPPGGPAPGGR
jgi:hypothetical protein